MIKEERQSPNKNRNNLSPNFYESKASNNNFIPIRATLKNLVKGKTPEKIILNDRIVNKRYFMME